jgi:hypothetical protein
MGDREGNFISHLLRVFFAIDADGDHRHTQLIQAFLFIFEAD